MACLDSGEVAEWLKAPHSKCGILARVSRVRIPPSPPGTSSALDIAYVFHVAGAQPPVASTIRSGQRDRPVGRTDPGICAGIDRGAEDLAEAREAVLPGAFLPGGGGCSGLMCGKAGARSRAVPLRSTRMARSASPG